MKQVGEGFFWTIVEVKSKKLLRNKIRVCFFVENLHSNLPYDNHYWRNQAGTYHATILITDWYLYNNICKAQIPDLDNKTFYELTPYDHSLSHTMEEV